MTTKELNSYMVEGNILFLKIPNKNSTTKFLSGRKLLLCYLEVVGKIALWKQEHHQTEHKFP